MRSSRREELRVVSVNPLRGAFPTALMQERKHDVAGFMQELGCAFYSLSVLQCISKLLLMMLNPFIWMKVFAIH
jgi:hypothetical protein